MSSMTINVNDTVLETVKAAYDVDTNAKLKAAIIADIKNKVKDYMVRQVEVAEAQKVQAAIEAKLNAVTMADVTAQASVDIS